MSVAKNIVKGFERFLGVAEPIDVGIWKRRRRFTVVARVASGGDLKALRAEAKSKFRRLARSG